MFLPRVIPCLLLSGRGLVKTTGFKDPRYLGDPRNTVRIFNEKEVDELVLLDIRATMTGQPPQFELIEEIVGEAFMPIACGGGIRSLQECSRMFELGVEKVVLNTNALENPGFIAAVAKEFGSQSIVVCIDAKKRKLGGYRAYTRAGSRDTGQEPAAVAVAMQAAGAGELLIQSIDRDGTMKGYDLDLVREVTGHVTIPVVACGGAGSVADLESAVRTGGASAAAAGSMFVFHGRHRAVLISFPDQQELTGLFTEAAT
jgi:imidazole glycerol-phosphate synthase subunit HisF